MTEVQTGKDRREWDRLPVAIPVFVRGVDEHGKNFLEFTSLLNISAGGGLLALRRYVPESSEVTLEIPSAPMPPLADTHHFVRKIPAHMVRVLHSDRSNLCGLKFDTPLA